VDIGPGAGKLGGEIVAAGPTAGLVAEKPSGVVAGDPKKSLTLKYLRGEERIAIRARRQSSRERLLVKGAAVNNLKKIDVEIPLKRFVALTGVSGSGKSSLLGDTIFPAISNKLYGTRYPVGAHRAVLGLEYLDKVIAIDQSAIGRTPRSNPATYTGAWTHIRELFAETAEARARAYKPGRFSFNVPGGRCENCQGNGTIAIEMHFLPTVYVTCDVCRGKRFDRETLEVKYNNKNIHEVLNMTVVEADEFFRNIPFIHDKLKILSEVGLGYLELGQSATTLSGGEAQRVKLGAELSRRQTGRTLYILDEPTVGLHFDDVKKLIEVLSRLVQAGNSVVVIEHNLDVIKCADWVIDLGPEGGDKGGRVVAVGAPEDIARAENSFTGQYLKKALKTV
jgi:excinuclease ABC subunit A